MFPPYTFPDRWGPVWHSTGQRGPPPPWASPCWKTTRAYTREEMYRLGQDINWVTLGTSGFT